MTRNTKKIWFLTFTLSLASIITLSCSTNTSNPIFEMSSKIMVADNNLNYTSTLPSFPEQLLNLSEQVSPRAVMEYSTQVFKEDIHISDQLLTLTALVTPRLRTEYTSKMLYDQLSNPPDDLEQITSLAKPRIMIEYSTLLFTSSLVRRVDINGDDKIDHKDLLLLAGAYGSKCEDPRYDPLADLNADGKVDHKDLLILAADYGKET